MKILDRYLVREIMPPFVIALLVLTFALMMPPILRDGEALVAKGVAWLTIARVLWTLAPQALSITIPMALLVGILVALGRVSADREFVALQACGVSAFRVLRPIALLAVLGTAATAYETIVALPDANQTFREITFNIVASSAETDIKPRIFFANFPSRILYVRDMQPGVGWRDVFFADDTKREQTTIYFARNGRLLIDRAKRTVQLLLEDGTSHTTFSTRPDGYDGSAFGTLILNMDADTVFPRTQVIKGDNEMSIPELHARIAENTKAGLPSPREYFTIQQKFAIPVACIVLSLIGLALGVNNRKEGKLATIALGLGVIFVYYILLYSSRAAAFAGRLPPGLAPWVANVLLGALGIGLVIWRAGAADQPIRIPIPSSWPWRRRSANDQASGKPRMAARRRLVLRMRLPHLDWARPSLLDLYVSRQYLAAFGLSFAGLVGIFYISTFIDLADRLFGGATTTGMLLRYFYFQTPQYIYYIIPLAALVATLVTIGVMTKSSELVVTRACGISLYRSSTPLLLFALLLSALLFDLQERVLADWNREARRLNAIIRGLPPATFGVLNRRWLVGASGNIYHYEFYDPRANHFTRLSMFHVDDAAWKLGALTFAKDVELSGQPGSGEGQPALSWVARDGWRREFSTAGTGPNEHTTVKYAPFAEQAVSLEPPAYFKETEDPDADRMTFGELKQYITQLQTSGYHAVPYMVQLQRKIAFPFVTLIMTLLAVPFAVTTGRRGAMSGIGIGIVFAIVYWTAQSIFGALGAGGWIAPTLAAWAPNIMFGAAALYMVLTVRT